MNTPQLKTCDILLYKGTGFVSWLIRWGTNSPYSHVAVVVSREMNLGIESNTGRQSGVRAFDLRKLKAPVVDVFRLKPEFANQVNREAVIALLVSRLGAKYDFLGVIALGFLKALSFLTGFKTFRAFSRFQRDRDYFCSEIVYEAFEKGGLDIVPEVDEAENTSPGDIARSERLEKVLSESGIETVRMTR